MNEKTILFKNFADEATMSSHHSVNPIDQHLWEALTPHEDIDTELFRRAISLHSSFDRSQRSNLVYRIVFFLFGLFFLTTAMMIYALNPNFACELYFSNSHYVKNVMNVFSFFLAFTSFILGYALRPAGSSDSSAEERLANRIRPLSCSQKSALQDYKII